MSKNGGIKLEPWKPLCEKKKRNERNEQVCLSCYRKGMENIHKLRRNNSSGV